MSWLFATPKTAPDNSHFYFDITEVAADLEMEGIPTSTITASPNGPFAPATLQNYLLELYSEFLKVHGRRFSKPYTPAQLIKATKNQFTITGDGQSSMPSEELNWVFTPNKIIVQRSGSFTIVWTANGTQTQIELEDLAGEIQEVTDIGESDDFLRLTSDKQLHDRKYIEQARLRAKVAKFKAEKAMARYLEKYGYDSDILESDSGEDSDDSSESEYSSDEGH